VARGVSDILNSAELRGLNLFAGRARCIECHSGPAFSTGSLDSSDAHGMDGRKLVNAERLTEFCLASKYSDADKNTIMSPGKRSGVRVPSLRNVEVTGPYMHDGSMTDLDKVLRAYQGCDGLKQLNDQERSDLREFLLTLTDVALKADPKGAGLSAIGRRINLMGKN